jgi:hypothetical protein
MNKRFTILYLIIIMLIILPFATAWQVQGEKIFTGMLFNPIDGYSYLAKIRQGLDGNWLFYLPYTAEKGGGAYIFLFYVFLGHLARLLHVTPGLIFHIARVAGSVFLLWSIHRLLRCRLRFDDREVILTMLLVSLGAGLGWAAIFNNIILPDFWLAEAYPFLSMFANPHFALGMGLMTYILSFDHERTGWKSIFMLMFSGMALSIVLPFGFVCAFLITAIDLLWKTLEKRNTYSPINVVTMIPGGLWILYQYAAVIEDPVLSQWNSQNITATPPIMELLAALTPAALAAAAGITIAIRKREIPGRELLVTWSVVCLLLAVLPFGVQRRFLTGIFIPLVLLAVIALKELRLRQQKIYKTALILFLAISMPTNLITLSIFTSAGLEQKDELFLTKGEHEAFLWINENLPRETLCLSGLATGLLLPAYSHCRVLYGHPLESLENEKEGVTEFFLAEKPVFEKEDYLAEKKLDVVIYAKRDEANQSIIIPSILEEIYRNDDIQIYRVIR